jgi:hypothetical protein
MVSTFKNRRCVKSKNNKSFLKNSSWEKGFEETMRKTDFYLNIYYITPYIATGICLCLIFYSVLLGNSIIFIMGMLSLLIAFVLMFSTEQVETRLRSWFIRKFINKNNE